MRYVYEIPDAIIGRISQAEPEKLASVDKPKTPRVLRIAVFGFVGDHYWIITYTFTFTFTSFKGQKARGGGGGYSQKNWVGCGARFPKPLPYL